MIGEATASAMGVGAMSFAEFYGPTTQEDSAAIMEAAIEAGVTHIDMSNVYGMGRSERAIGAALAAHPGLRDKLHIATKAGIVRGVCRKPPFRQLCRVTPEDLTRIETILPVGWAHGDRYSDAQWLGPERYPQDNSTPCSGARPPCARPDPALPHRPKAAIRAHVASADQPQGKEIEQGRILRPSLFSGPPDQ